MNRGSSATWLDWLVVVMVLGYLSMSRSFARVGVPPLYLGELALAAFVLLRPEAVLRPWLAALRRPSPLSGVAGAVALLLGYGALEVVRGLDTGYGLMTAVQGAVFNVYPLYVFVGVWAGRRGPQTLPGLLRLLAWWHGIYGVAWILVLNRVGVAEEYIPGEVAWFGQPYGAAVALLGLLSFEKDWRRAWLPLLLNSFVLLGLQVRAAWLSFALCLVLWGYLAGHLKKVALVAAVIAGLLFVGLVADIRIPSPEGRGGELSARELFSRALAAVSPKAAQAFSPHADFYGETLSWRTSWWAEMWKMVHTEPVRAVLGTGYGYPLWELHPEDDLSDNHIRTPHNVFMFALVYSGWLGVVLFYALALSLGLLLWQTYLRTGQPFGVCYWMMTLVWAHFDNFFEAPFGAIPCYLLIGLAVSPLCRTPEPTPRPQAGGAGGAR